MLYPFEAHDIGIFCSYGCVGKSCFFFPFIFLIPGDCGEDDDSPWDVVGPCSSCSRRLGELGMVSGWSIHSWPILCFFFFNGTISWLHHKMGSLK